MNVSSGLLASLPFVIFSLGVGQQAAAETLDSEMTKKLLSDQTWVRKAYAGGRDSYWSWKSDGTVCVRLFGRKGKCDDTGRWKKDGERVCYQMEWWSDHGGEKSACFRIAHAGKGRYEALEANGLVMFEFTVSK